MNSWQEAEENNLYKSNGWLIHLNQFPMEKLFEILFIKKWWLIMFKWAED